jgi:type IV pilus assembly protein PilB
MEQTPLGQILLKSGALTEERLKKALEHAKRSETRLGDALLHLGYVSDNEVAKALAQQLGLKFVDLSKSPRNPDLAKLVPRDVAEEYGMVPLACKDGVVTVAMAEPPDLYAVDNLRFILNCEISFVLAGKDTVRDAISSLYGTKDTPEEMIEGMATDELKALEEEGEGEEALGGEDAPVIKLVKAVILEGIRARASDIHVEPMADRIRIRYRVDGVCYEVDSPPKRLQNSIVTRLKILSGMNIAEKRLPLDGRIRTHAFGRNLDMRVSSLPATHGPSVVLRILDRESLLLGVAELGFHEDDFARFERITRRPNGIFLVTGPTGSGKTTTLYAALNELNRPDVKIVTAEDPVEYNLSGINQCQVLEEIGLNFSAILRSALRQAPDVILVGEIRDTETAETAVTAALTGHLVFSTLHTNDAPSAIPRLIDLGLPPFLVASAVQAIMAQRLVRKLCKKCRRPHVYSEDELRAVGLRPEDVEEVTLFRAVGCANCKHTGYRGRLGIFELLEMDETLRDMTYRKAPLDEIRHQARLSGMVSLQEDGLRKILAGITSVEEVLTVTHETLE